MIFPKKLQLPGGTQIWAGTQICAPKHKAVDCTVVCQKHGLIWCQFDVEFHGDFIFFWFQKPISHRSKVMDTQLLVAKRQCKQCHNNLGYACPN